MGPNKYQTLFSWFRTRLVLGKWVPIATLMWHSQMQTMIFTSQIIERTKKFHHGGALLSFIKCNLTPGTIHTIKCERYGQKSIYQYYRYFWTLVQKARTKQNFPKTILLVGVIKFQENNLVRHHTILPRESHFNSRWALVGGGDILTCRLFIKSRHNKR